LIEDMANPSEIAEAEELLNELRSWNDEDVEELPKLYREKAREFRQLTQQAQK